MLKAKSGKSPLNQIHINFSKHIVVEQEPEPEPEPETLASKFF
jgi:hypothetical protein